MAYKWCQQGTAREREKEASVKIVRECVRFVSQYTSFMKFPYVGFGVGYFSTRVLATGWSLSLETNGSQYQEICSNYFFDHFLPFIFFLLSLLLSLSF